MSVLYGFEGKQAEKKAEELKALLIDLDSVCDILYNRLDYSGIWEALMELEDVRVKYYLEYFEYNDIVDSKGKK